MHRACVSAISTFGLSLAEDLTFWERHGITTVGVSVAKLERSVGTKGTKLVADAVGRGLRVADLIGLGPFHLANPTSWPQQQDRLVHSIETAVARCGAGAWCSRPGRSRRSRGRRPPTRSSDALARAGAKRAPACRFAIEHTNSLRVDVGFVHTLRDAIDLARRLRHRRVHGAQRVLGRAGAQQTIRDGIDRIRLVQVSDFKVGTVASSQRLVPGDGDIPIARDPRRVLDAGLRGCLRPRADRRRDHRRGLRRRGAVCRRPARTRCSPDLGA